MLSLKSAITVLSHGQGEKHTAYHVNQFEIGHAHLKQKMMIDTQITFVHPKTLIRRRSTKRNRKAVAKLFA